MERLGQDKLDEGFRLACQTLVTGDVAISWGDEDVERLNKIAERRIRSAQLASIAGLIRSDETEKPEDTPPVFPFARKGRVPPRFAQTARSALDGPSDQPSSQARRFKTPASHPGQQIGRHFMNDPFNFPDGHATVSLRNGSA